jgi:NADP-dependent 3-hydroxy acid dehydrogenase YdfG
VTGASSGIGRAVARRLARDGAHVLATGRDQHPLEALAKEAGGEGGILLHHPADLTSDRDRVRLAETLREQLGPVSVLVHSAGAYARGIMRTAPVADLDNLFAVNVRAPYALTQLLLPELVSTRGDVVFVNSIQGLSAGAGVGQYAASKHTLRAVADSLRAEVADVGVRVCTVFPGRTATPMQEKIFLAEGRTWDPDLLLHPDDVAAAVTAALALPPRAEITEIVIRPAGKL